MDTLKNLPGIVFDFLGKLVSGLALFSLLTVFAGKELSSPLHAIVGDRLASSTGLLIGMLLLVGYVLGLLLDQVADAILESGLFQRERERVLGGSPALFPAEVEDWLSGQFPVERKPRWRQQFYLIHDQLRLKCERSSFFLSKMRSDIRTLMGFSLVSLFSWPCFSWSGSFWLSVLMGFCISILLFLRARELYLRHTKAVVNLAFINFGPSPQSVPAAGPPGEEPGQASGSPLEAPSRQDPAKGLARGPLPPETGRGDAP